MAIDAIIIPENGAMRRLSITEPSQLYEAPPEPAAAVIVVSKSAGNCFSSYTNKFTMRGQQHDAKELAAYLLGQPNIPVITGKYNHRGRLMQGVRSLLRSAAEAGERKLYIVTLDDDLFRELYNGAVPPGEEAKQTGPDVPPPLPAVPDGVMRDLKKRIIGESEEYEKVRRKIWLAAREHVSVLILGETGTGKSKIARAIHDHSGRSGKCIEINCGAIPLELLESELFGHVKGSFTYAHRDKTGRWEDANHGTLFLDEIADLRKEHQVKVLRALQEKKIQRVGANFEIEVDVRIIAATNQNLWALVQNGAFRQDLYFRLGAFQIKAPPLRGHPETIAEIARKCWRDIAGQEAKLTQDIVEKLCRRRWPGNVRELKSVLASMYALYHEECPELAHLQAALEECREPDDRGEQPADSVTAFQLECLRHLQAADEVIRSCEDALKGIAAGQPPDDVTRRSVAELREDLCALLRRRLHFHNKTTYQAVLRIDEDLRNLLALRSHSSEEVSKFWNGTLAADIGQAVSCLFDALREVRTL